MTLEEDAWVWVAVLDPEGDPRFLGRHDVERDESFIPAFRSREAAGDWVEQAGGEPGVRVEVQAIRYGDLRRRAGESGFSVVILDACPVLDKGGTVTR
jgi:hypothetical protein